MSSLNQSSGITVDEDGPVATVWLDRADRGNAFTRAMQDALHTALAELDASEDVRAIVVTGRGKLFSAGADLEKGGSAFADDDAETARLRTVMAARPRPWKLRTPIIGALNGSAVGLGLTFALQWDIRIVAEEAKYGLVFARRGVMPEQGSLWLLPKLIGVETALELLFTGRLILGAEAARLGLASRAVPAAEVLPTALVLAREIAENTSGAIVGIAKEMVYGWLGEPDRESAFSTEWELLRWSGRQPDAAEGVASFLEKRPPVFTVPKSIAPQVPDGKPWAGP